MASGQPCPHLTEISDQLLASTAWYQVLDTCKTVLGNLRFEWPPSFHIRVSVVPIETHWSMTHWPNMVERGEASGFPGPPKVTRQFDYACAGKWVGIHSNWLLFIETWCLAVRVRALCWTATVRSISCWESNKHPPEAVCLPQSGLCFPHCLAVMATRPVWITPHLYRIYMWLGNGYIVLGYGRFPPVTLGYFCGL